MKNETKTVLKARCGTDVVLGEIWRIKDTLSASYGHDVHRLFAETRAHEKTSNHPQVSVADLRKKTANLPD
jgi:hypothetical protein